MWVGSRLPKSCFHQLPKGTRGRSNCWKRMKRIMAGAGASNDITGFELNRQLQIPRLVSNCLIESWLFSALTQAK